MEYLRVNNDINGNPRYVFHFLEFLNTEESFKPFTEMYNLALIRARSIGGKKYRGKDFGGGIVIQSYNIQDTIKQIQDASNTQ